MAICQLSVVSWNGFMHRLFMRRTYSHACKASSKLWPSQGHFCDGNTKWIILSSVSIDMLVPMCLTTLATVPISLTDSLALVPNSLGSELSRVRSVCTPTQQRIIDTCVWHLYLSPHHYDLIIFKKYDFWSVSSTRQIGCKITFNCLVLPILLL